MYDWMNSGPAPMDPTLLLQGIKTGNEWANAQADRGERIRADKAREDEMKQRLGLEEKAQNFQQSMWTSQGEMRAAQLDLTKNQAAESANSLINVVQDHTALTDGMGALDKLAAQNDFDSVLNAIPPAFQTPQASQAWQQHRNQLLQTSVGQSAALHQNAQLAIQKADIDTQTEQLKQVGQIPNADVNSFYDNGPDGSKVWNKGRAALAIDDFRKKEELEKSNLVTNREIAVVNAKGENYAKMLQSRESIAASKESMAALQTLQTTAQKDLASARAKSDAAGIARAQATLDRTTAQLRAAVSGQSAVEQPSAPASQSSTDWLNSLGQ